MSLPARSKSRPPAVQFFCKDWMADTSGLSHFQYACYHMLWCAARVQSDDWCSLPDDDFILARMCRTGVEKWKSARAELIPRFWVPLEGRLVNGRLMEEAEIQMQRRDQASFAGKRSALARTNDRSTTVQREDQRTGQRESNLAFASALKDLETKKTHLPEKASGARVRHAYPPGMIRFWQQYESKRRVGKADVLAQWQKHGLESRTDEMLSLLGRYKASESWQQGFEKEPARWLKRKPWEDEPAEAHETPDAFDRILGRSK